jgi:hypothetical protein
MSDEPGPRPTPGDAPRAGPYRLVCDSCGATRACSADDVLVYARSKWPRCCGWEMSYAPARGAPPAPGQP